MGFDNGLLYANGIDLSGEETKSNRLNQDGYIYIGNSTGNPISAPLNSKTNAISIENSPGNIEFDLKMTSSDGSVHISEVSQGKDFYINKSMRLKAWANFNASDGTINKGFNISQIVKDDTGTYSLTFEEGMESENYACIITPEDTQGTIINSQASSKSKSGMTISCRGGTVNLLGIDVALIDLIDPDGTLSVIVAG